MKHIIFALIFAFVGSSAYSQALEWAKRIGGTDIEVGNSIITDTLGNVYTTGYFQGTGDFNPGANTFNLSSVGGDDIFISKLDSAGNFVWAKRIGGTGQDRGNAIKLDASGNIYITGYFQNTVDFDPSVNTFNLISAGYDDIFIAKLDAGGNLVWAKSLGGSFTDNGNTLAVDSQGNVYTMGNFNGTADFDPSANSFNLVSVGASDVFISKLDSSGNFVWAKCFGGTWYDGGNSLALDAQGNVYTTGSFSNTVDFDPNVGVYTLNSTGNTDIFMTKLDTAGNFVWAKQIGDFDYDYGYSIALDIEGNVYTTGIFKGTADFDPNNGIDNHSSQGNGDIFISKLDILGNYIWAKTMGGTADDIGTSIALDAQGNVYTTGYFQNSVDFDPGIGTYNVVSGGITDIFISKLDASGNFSWTEAIGGTIQDNGNAITKDVLGNIFTTGSFQNAADFDPSNGIYYLSSWGNKDIFVHKMFDCTANFNTLTITTCDTYTINGQSYTLSGTYTQTLINAIGCDSILTLNLTIYHPTDSTINQIACDTFAFNGQTFTASGNYTHYFTNSNGCDSTVYLNLSMSNIGTDTLIETACQYYILNGQTYTSSGTYSQAIAGCDSAITLMLTINTPTTSTTTQTACNTYTLDGQIYYSTGIYQQTLTNIQGCDSILTLNLTINHSTDTLITQTACDSFTLNGQIYNTSGVYTQTLTNATGCDSLITLNLSLNYSTYDTLTQDVCGSITLNGHTYTTSGTYTQTLTNVMGCDSILTLNLIIGNENNISMSDFGCDQYWWYEGDQILTSSGTYTQTYTNIFGCDSVYTLNLTVGETIYEPWNAIYVCDYYECNGQIYYSSLPEQPCYEAYINSTGCYTYTEIQYWVTSSEGISLGSQTSCGAYYNNEGDVFTTSGDYSWAIPFNDCGGYYYINLTIIPTPDSTVTQNGSTLIANATNVSYQWLDCSSSTPTPIPGATNQIFAPSSNGFYAVTVTENINNCQSTSKCYQVTLEANHLQSQFQAYPNPTKGSLTIDLGTEYDIAEVKNHNLIGQLLSTQKYTHSQLLAVDMPEVTGIYFVSVKVGSGEIVTVKVVKE